MENKTESCAACHYARARGDIDGTYCTGSFWADDNGGCDRHMTGPEPEKE